MRFFSTSLILIYITIAALTVSMIWQFSNFERNIKNASFNLPQGMTQDISGGLDKMMEGNTGAPAQKFTTADGYLTFEYPASWSAVNIGSSNATSTQGIFFSASKITIKSLSLSYLIGKKSNAATIDEAINNFRQESEGGGATAQITRSELETNQGKKITLFESVFQMVQNSLGTNSLNSANAIILNNNNCYLISLYAPAEAWESAKQEANNIFKTITINNPQEEIPAENKSPENPGEQPDQQ